MEVQTRYFALTLKTSHFTKMREVIGINLDIAND